MPLVIAPNVPLQVTVDFQSRHLSAFRLFTRGANHNADWEFLKEGIEDSTAVTVVSPGGALQAEFLYFAETQQFRAVLVFRQHGQVLNGGTITVEGPGDARVLTEVVDFQ